MPTIREKYFAYLKTKKDHVSESDIRDLLIFHCGLKSYINLTLHFDDQISNEEKLDKLFDRLQNGEMLQYIFGEASFLGEKFKVDENVLIPRQETEQLLILTTDLIRYNFDTKNLKICDLCTGSGILAIMLKKEFQNAEVFASDLSEKAIKICKQNTDKFGQVIRLLQGNYVEPLLDLKQKFDAIICNPPYIENEDEIDERTWKQEPHLALLAKPATMFYEKLIKEIPNLMNPHFLIAFEIGETLEERLTEILNNNDLKGCYKFEKDIYGKTRFLFIMK